MIDCIVNDGMLGLLPLSSAAVCLLRMSESLESFVDSNLVLLSQLSPALCALCEN